MDQTAIRKMPVQPPLDREASVEHFLSLTVRPELAILGRINLVFSRRGLIIGEFHYREIRSLQHPDRMGTGLVEIRFQGNRIQLDSVTRDLKKIQDVITVEISA